MALFPAVSLLSSASDDSTPPIPVQRDYPTPLLSIEQLMGLPMGGDVMTNEPVLFTRKADGSSQGQLLFPPDEIVSIQDSALQTTYEAGKDYNWSPGSCVITLPPGSRIPSREFDSFYCAPDSPDAIAAATGAHEGKWLLYGESATVYCDSQVAITYRHRPAPQALPELVIKGDLEASVAQLKSGQPFKVALLGDSISEGCNASAAINKAPFMPPYGSLVVDGLKRAYGRDIQYVNLSKGGMTSAYGVAMIPAITAEKPDLLIIGFGMNDASHRVPPAEYGEAIARIIRETKKSLPDAGFVLVATMLGNPEWSGSNREMYDAYREQLSRLRASGIVIADMTRLWERLLEKKNYWDLTANGVNHPNDFGHRLYAQAILSALTPPNK